MSEPFKCPAHGIDVTVEEGGRFSDERQGCPKCLDQLHNAQDASEMTPEERVVELKYWEELPVTVRFDNLHKRFEQLIGRSVWTHEFARPELLHHEILTGDVPSMSGVLAKLPADKPVITLDPETGESKRVQ